MSVKRAHIVIDIKTSLFVGRCLFVKCIDFCLFACVMSFL